MNIIEHVLFYANEAESALTMFQDDSSFISHEVMIFRYKKINACIITDFDKVLT